jgi:hypothetical protein
MASKFGGSKKNIQSAKDTAYYQRQFARTEANLKRKGKTNKKRK